MTQKEEIDKEIKDLENAFLDNSQPFANQDDTLNRLSDQMRRSGYMDFRKVQDESRLEAEVTIDAIIGYHVEDDLRIRPHVQERKKIDIIALGDLICQMKTSEHSIIKLLEDIDSGNYTTRSFEVLSRLQESKMNIIKHLAQYQVILENTYRNIQREEIIKQEERAALSPSSSAVKAFLPSPSSSPTIIGESLEVQEEQEVQMPIKARGTRELIMNMKKNFEEKNGKEADILKNNSPARNTIIKEEENE